MAGLIPSPLCAYRQAGSSPDQHHPVVDDRARRGSIEKTRAPRQVVGTSTGRWPAATTVTLLGPLQTCI
jgi:hypothetical protein